MLPLQKLFSLPYFRLPLAGIGKRKEEPLLSSPIPVRGATFWSTSCRFKTCAKVIHKLERLSTNLSTYSRTCKVYVGCMEMLDGEL